MAKDQAQEPRTGVVDAAAFGCEIAMLVTLAVAGSGLGSNRAVHVVAAIALPLLVAGIWGVWMAPTSSRRLGDPARFVAQVVLFVATAVLAAASGRVVWGIVLAVVSIAVFAATRRTGERDAG